MPKKSWKELLGGGDDPIARINRWGFENIQNAGVPKAKKSDEGEKFQRWRRNRAQLQDRVWQPQFSREVKQIRTERQQTATAARRVAQAGDRIPPDTTVQPGFDMRQQMVTRRQAQKPAPKAKPAINPERIKRGMTL